MTMAREIAAVMLLNLRNLPGRSWSALVIVVGMACVVGVLLSMLSLVTGLVQSEMKAGDPGRAIILSQGMDNEGGSSVRRDEAAIIMDSPGIRKDADGSPLAEGEIVIPTPAVTKTGITIFLLTRGLGTKGLALRPEIKLLAGRMFKPGARELVVGKAIQGQVAGMELGDKVTMPDGQWPIVGVFATGGDIVEGELLADRDTLMAATHKGEYSSVLARLETGPDAMERLKAALAGNRALSVTAERHSTYYENLAGPAVKLFLPVAYATGIIMALGALFGALKIMYGAVSRRALEIGTLRALGFGGLPVAASVVAECLLLALIGALIGCVLAWTLFDGSQKSYFGNIFDLKVTPGLIGLGLLWALAVGLLGGLLPSIRAARLSIVEALRAR